MKTFLRSATVLTLAIACLAGAGSANATASQPTGQASAGSWESEFTAGYVLVNFRLKGKVADRRGNFHSGSIYFEGDDDGLVAGVTDWTCPPGKVPPVLWGIETDCVIEGSLGIEDPELLGSAGVDWNLKRIRLQSHVATGTDSATGDVANQTIALRLRGTGQLSRDVSRFTDLDGTRYLDRRVQRLSGKLISGRIGWLNLADPRIQVLGVTMSRYDILVRRPAAV